MFKKIFLCILILFFFLPQMVKAEEIIYTIKNAGDQEVLATFSSYRQANGYYNSHLKEYQNLVFYENENVIKMEYGIVEFKVSDGCTYNVSYRDLNDDEGYLNGCYGVDAAYITSSTDASKVTFKIAGVVAVASIHDVTLIPYEDLKVRLSRYEVKDGYLYHQIKTQLESDYYASNYKLMAIDGLEDGFYYSYDGHYFYHDFYQMIDDYRAFDYGNASNPSIFYNYYQYLPHRSLSNYGASDLKYYFEDVLHFEDKLTSYYDLNRDSANDVVNASQYVGEYASFFAYQNIYGANALMMLSLSINESAYGKSLLSYTRNNLFGHAAFDEDVERNAARYLDVKSSIYAHARYYISERYSNHLKYLYHGSFFGDKNSGMNVMYASDPYWGEKAASHYQMLDEALGNKDLNQYALAIIQDEKRLSLYEDETCTNLLYYLHDLKDFSLIVLKEYENAYKIQLDTSLDENGYYSFIDNVAYIEKDVVDYILNEEIMHEDEYVQIHFDADGGLFQKEESMTIQAKKGAEISFLDARKDGFEFIGFSNDLLIANEDTTYKALYKEIDHIELVSPMKEEIEYLSFYDLQDAKLMVYYKDNTFKIIPLNTNHISNIDPTTAGQQTAYIDYAGFQLEVPIYISMELHTLNEEVRALISKNIRQYQKDGSYQIDELLKIKEAIEKVDYLLDFEEIRYLDAMLLDYYRDQVGFVLDDQYDISISGMALALDITKEDLPYYQNTYYLELDAISLKAKNKLRAVSEAYGFKEESTFSLSFKENLKTIQVKTPFIVQIAIDDKKQDQIYTVYRYDEDGSVNKCRTTQTTSFIQFLTEKEGEFMVLSMDSSNQYDFKDAYENLHQENQDEDLHKQFYSLSMLAISILVAMILLLNLKRIKTKEEYIWNDYKKLLHKVEFVQEEKLKN